MASSLEARRKEKSNKLFFTQQTRDGDIIQGGSSTGSGLQVQLMYDKLEKLMRKELSKWWEIESLQQYMEVERVPRDLRIYTIPSYEDPDPELLEEWAENSKTSSLNMMRILIKYASKERIKIVEEIDKITQVILTLVSQKTFDEVKDNLDKKLSKFEEEITVKKQRKFIRDYKDYQSGRILTFHHKNDHMYTEGYKESIPSGDKSSSGVNLGLTEESDVSDGNLSDASEITAEQIRDVDASVNRSNFSKQFCLLNQGRTEQTKDFQSRGRGRGQRGRGRGTGQRRQEERKEVPMTMAMTTRARKNPQ
ncbi:hypothetical protein NDU88_005147 [Pleurodeles waltl]|uniref:Uncharacterized protein n=1 Tax=Pleurodeles waltl TaxID=8319 RepID=A0AAV7TA61_PLEWA|nr:hypothetical protein NDU88_005147 [Pleurodeles waltl]